MIGKDEYLDLNHHSILYIYRCCVISLIVKLCCQKESKTHRPPFLSLLDMIKLIRLILKVLYHVIKSGCCFIFIYIKKMSIKLEINPCCRGLVMIQNDKLLKENRVLF